MQVHRGVRTLKSTPKYIKRKSNCVARVHLGVDTAHALEMVVMLGIRNK